jgi:hypothetical protein
LNELLDFVRRDHANHPEPSTLILSFTALTAAWRFIFDDHQHSLLERAQSIQATPSFNYWCASPASRRLIHAFEFYHSTGI